MPNTTSCSSCEEVAEKKKNDSKQQLARLIKRAALSARGALASPSSSKEVLILEGKPMARTPRSSCEELAKDEDVAGKKKHDRKKQFSRLIKLAARSLASRSTQKVLHVEGKPMTRTPRCDHSLDVFDPQGRSSSGKWCDESNDAHDVDDHPGNKALMKHLSDTRKSWHLPEATGYKWMKNMFARGWRVQLL
jgi:hypothetical protein